MIRSMTAFATARTRLQGAELALELRSVNHRYLEISPRLPEELRAHEGLLRERLARQVSRGKLDVTARIERPAQTDHELALDMEFVKALGKACHAIDAHLMNPGRVNPLDILRWPGVLAQSGFAPEELQAALNEALDEALRGFARARADEGARLSALIVQRLDEMVTGVESVRQRRPAVLAALRERVLGRLGELDIAADPGRLEQELALQAQRLDVSEELDRLEAHIAQMREVLTRDEPVGRRLDFLTQELNREANTLASKSADLATTRAAMDLKVLIEQIREQVQNIE